MSSLVFPALAGIELVGERTPVWSTRAQEALSGKESRVRKRAYPIYEWELNFELLRDDITTSDLQTIVGFFNSLAGMWDTFLYSDPYFNSVTAQAFGVGNGSQTTFPITAIYAPSGGNGIAELIQNFNGQPQIYINGTLLPYSSGLSVDGQGNAIFPAGHIPSSGATLTWTGGFYYRCRFMDDRLKPNEFMKRWWSLKKLRFKSIKL